MVRGRLKGFFAMFGLGSGADRQDIDDRAAVGALVEVVNESGHTGVLGTVRAADVDCNDDPAAPRIEDEDSTVLFEDAFEVVVDSERGKPIPDPLTLLTPEERGEYRDQLEDVIKAQRYGRSFGSVSRR